MCSTAACAKEGVVRRCQRIASQKTRLGSRLASTHVMRVPHWHRPAWNYSERLPFGLSRISPKERAMRSLRLQAGIAVIALALSAPVAFGQTGGAGGGGGTGGAGGGGAGTSGGGAGTGAASPSATTSSPGMAPSSVTGGTTGAGAAPPSSTGSAAPGGTAPGNPIPSGTGPAPERTPGQSTSTPSHNVPRTGAPAGIPRATARPPSGQATLPTNPPAGGNVTTPSTSGRGHRRTGSDRPVGGIDPSGTPKIMNDPSLGPIR